MHTEAGFENIIDQFGSMVWRICGTYEADPELRRDLYQDVLLALWRALPRFKGESSLKTYVARVAHNRSISHVSREVSRVKPTELTTEMPDTKLTPEDETSKTLARHKLTQAVRQLPIEYRQVTAMTLEDFTPREIAEVLGVSANTVSIRLTRAKILLKAAL